MRRGGSPKGSKQHRVHEAVIDGVTRRVKFCPGCDRTKIAEDGAADAGFYVHSRVRRRSVIFYPRCKECRALEERQRRETDPEYAERARARERAARKRWLEKPENQEKARAACLAYYHRRAESDRDGINETARLNYALRVERLEGRQVQHHSTVIDGTVPRVLAEPWRRWLLAYQLVTGLRDADPMGAALGIQPARIRLVLDGQKNVALDVVDCALLNADVIVEVDGEPVFTINDLYPLEDAVAA